MLLRLRLMLISLGIGTVLFMLLCLGAQNLRDRHSIQVGSSRSVPLPTGFLVGLSLVIGVVSGGSAAAVMLPEQHWD
ncbi:putative conserved membrane protein [Synechococcus sp. RS9915]|nr:putative conserved membrane protein [Synechococcus sp. RS9915]